MPPKATISPRHSRKASAANGTISKPVPIQPATSTITLDTMEHISKIPVSLRFPLALFLSYGLSLLLFSVASEVTGGGLGPVSKTPVGWWDPLGLLLWRAVGLGVYWALGYDLWDTASLTILTHTPALTLLRLFYAIRPTTLYTTLAINTLSTTFPFILLRPSLPFHNPHSAPRGTLSNRSILADWQTALLTTVLATLNFTLFLYASFYTWLPVYLVTWFDGIRDISAAHLGASGFLTLAVALLPTGYAAYNFLFVSSTGLSHPAFPGAATTTVTGGAMIEKMAFDPTTATLTETAFHNAWGWYTPREKILIGRTVLLAIMVAANTFIQVWGTIAGAEVWGAVGWAGVWVGAVLATGAGFAWVGGVDGV